ncbi:hypothetical protein MCERHM32_01185 [Methylophilaceae bacterium]
MCVDLGPLMPQLQQRVICNKLPDCHDLVKVFNAELS